MTVDKGKVLGIELHVPQLLHFELLAVDEAVCLGRVLTNQVYELSRFEVVDFELVIERSLQRTRLSHRHPIR